jgi:hypothetical protein
VGEDAGLWGGCRTMAKQLYLKISDIAIKEHFLAVDTHDACNDRIYVIAVPYIAGF